MPQKIAPILDADGRRLCGRCRLRPAVPRLIARRDYRCQPCRNIGNAAASERYRRTGKVRVVQQRYRATAKGKATARRNQTRRIYFGGRYRSVARTAEDAAFIRSHIKRRISEFVSQQKESRCHCRETVGKSGS